MTLAVPRFNGPDTIFITELLKAEGTGLPENFLINNDLQDPFSVIQRTTWGQIKLIPGGSDLSQD